MGKGLWILLLSATALVIAGFASAYLWQPPSSYSFVGQRETYAANAITIMTHIGCGIVALLTGLIQFLPAVKKRRKQHRWIGGVYVFSVFCGGVAGLHAATFAAGGASNVVAFTLFSIIWLTTTSMAMISVLKGKIADHQVWMKRSYAVTFAAVTFRIELGLLIGVGGLSFSEAYLVVPWTSWILNLLLVEWVGAFRKFRVPMTSKASY
ncbi:MAG: DUF2306 domain-containing protein [Lysobacterales bacterium]